MKRSPESKKLSNKSGNLTRARALVLAPLLLAAACSISEDPKSNNASSRVAPTELSTTSVAPNTMPTTTIASPVDRYSETTAYIENQERKDNLTSTLMTSGSRIVELAEKGTQGRFDFYNTDTNQWGRGKGNEGWGYLQQYTRNGYGILATVYQNPDGTFDLDRGVLSVDVHSDSGIGYSITNDQNDLTSMLTIPTSQGEYDFIRTERSFYQTVEELANIDRLTVTGINDTLTAFTSR